MKQRFQMALRVIPAFYDNYLYIGAINDSIKDKLDKINTNPEDTVVISYHSIPLQFHLKGDPYGRHCLQTTELIKLVTNDCFIALIHRKGLGSIMLIYLSLLTWLAQMHFRIKYSHQRIIWR